MLLPSGCREKKPADLLKDEKNLEEQGKEELRKLESLYSGKEEWETRKSALREDISKRNESLAFACKRLH